MFSITVFFPVEKWETYLEAVAERLQTRLSSLSDEDLQLKPEDVAVTAAPTVQVKSTHLLVVVDDHSDKPRSHRLLRQIANAVADEVSAIFPDGPPPYVTCISGSSRAVSNNRRQISQA